MLNMYRFIGSKEIGYLLMVCVETCCHLQTEIDDYMRANKKSTVFKCQYENGECFDSSTMEYFFCFTTCNNRIPIKIKERYV